MAEYQSTHTGAQIDAAVSKATDLPTATELADTYATKTEVTTGLAGKQGTLTVNPATTTGTLSSIGINGTNYAVGGQTLYLHSIKTGISYDFNWYGVAFVIISTESQSYSYDSLREAIASSNRAWTVLGGYFNSYSTSGNSFTAKGISVNGIYASGNNLVVYGTRSFTMNETFSFTISGSNISVSKSRSSTTTEYWSGNVSTSFYDDEVKPLV